MGRPPLPLGTSGKVLFATLPNGRVKARVKFRDYDGRVRLVSKVGLSRAAAERALKAELTSRQAPGGVGTITSSTRMVILADAWMDADHGWSTGTQRTYRSVINKQVKPAFGRLCIREVTPGVVSRALAAIAKSSGPGAAKTTRACLSGMFALAIQDGAAAVNPVRDSAAKISTVKRAPRALTVDETSRLLELFRSSDRAAELDLPDLVDWMLATGCRIGEALALRYGTNGDGRPILDLGARTWEVNATVVRVPGTGLAIQPRPKTTAGWRVVALPHFAVRMLENRRGRFRRQSDAEVVFPPPLSGVLRDPSNVSGDLRQLLDSFECETCAGTGYQLNRDGAFKTEVAGRRIRCEEGPWSWVTSHTFRKTVATRLDEAGLSPRQVADQLGHANPSMTLDVYFGRQVVSAEAARVLDR
ncbi:tyrosine-type recombinase/integrase [Blastococcus sp. CT_GayMR16]|uniref:tyrosine-type recombinase/integrase n=1 Tax=Blastococcus sp. CT_GayMR16 TaxID=2559607 RepID=UPI001073F941|nr:tyrosine-type recombinase/integrase [Blastococcus sp. CT_GayMR16]TFV91217.1 site-specific integrase [Blastococcus sp. CT_GayMR16]